MNSAIYVAPYGAKWRYLLAPSAPTISAAIFQKQYRHFGAISAIALFFVDSAILALIWRQKCADMDSAIIAPY